VRRLGEDRVQQGPTRPAHARRADVQGLRAVAVGLVVAFHAGLPVPGGYVGVDMFFVISGFVISAMLQRELGTTGGLGFASFYTRRFRRLLPALAVATTFVALASILLLSPLGPQQATLRTGVAATLFAANVQLSQADGGGYFDLDAEANALLHTWSLSVEEQFYLVFPALVLVAWQLGRRRRPGGSVRVTAAVVAAAMAASFALSLLLTYRPSTRLGDSFAFYLSPTRAWEFGAGVLLAFGMARLRRTPVPVAHGFAVVGTALVAYASLAFDGATAFPGLAALVPVVGTALLIAAGTATDRGLPGLLASRPAVWVGDVSYGWYLWHWPLIVFAAAWWPGRTVPMVAAAVASLLPTVASYRWVENPIRFDDRIVGRRVVALVVACVAIPMAAFALAHVVGEIERSSEPVTAFAEEIREHEDRARGCDQPVPLGAREGDDCTWPATTASARAEIVLVGDSNAGHLTAPVTDAGNASGYDVTVATTAGCPFADLIRRESLEGDFDGEACHDQALTTRDHLIDRRPALVVISMSATEYVGDDAEHLRLPEGGERSDPEGKAEVWEEGIRRVVVPLREAGIAVLLVDPVPQFGPVLGDDWSAETCPALKVLRGSSCGGSRSRRDVDGDRSLVLAAHAAAVEGGAGAPVDVLDLADDVCDPSRCATERDGQQLYRDATHLTVEGSRTLTVRFIDAIDALVGPI
jgi:peptidoglycan/LPS O-acetylase OafA/YrhL